MGLEVRIRRAPHAEGIPLPEAGTAGSAGLDLRAAVEDALVLAPGERSAVPTGLHVAIPTGFEAQVRPRSGLALEHGILVPNAPGTIDSDYRGEIRVILMNAGTETFEVLRGDRIAQLVVAPVSRPEWVEVEFLDETERGAGGFGHTGQR